jgi:hypothetical protein
MKMNNHTPSQAGHPVRIFSRNIPENLPVTPYCRIIVRPHKVPPIISSPGHKGSAQIVGKRHGLASNFTRPPKHIPGSIHPSCSSKENIYRGAPIFPHANVCDKR